jgi:hypothetical protein
MGWRVSLSRAILCNNHAIVVLYGSRSSIALFGRMFRGFKSEIIRLLLFGEQISSARICLNCTL